jgi:hypothetical protein
MNGMRSRMTGAAVLLLASVQLAPAATAGTCESVKAVGRWTAVAFPGPSPDDVNTQAPLSAGPMAGSGDNERNLTHGLVAATGKALVVTNTRSIYRSSDGGCSWSTVYSLDGNGSNVPQDAAVRRITAIVPAGQNHLYGLVQLRPSGENLASYSSRANPLQLVTSRDGGGSWTLIQPTGPSYLPAGAADNQLPLRGSHAYFVSANNPGPLLIGSQTNADMFSGNSEMQHSVDNGRTFTATANPRLSSPALAAGPVPGTLWAYGVAGPGQYGQTPGALSRSRDNGSSWTAVLTPGYSGSAVDGQQGVTGFDILLGSAGRVAVVIGVRQPVPKGGDWTWGSYTTFFKSTDDGASWRALPPAPTLPEITKSAGVGNPRNSSPGWSSLRCVRTSCSTVIALRQGMDEGSAWAKQSPNLIAGNPRGLFWRSYIILHDGRRWSVDAPPPTLFGGKPMLSELLPADASHTRFVAPAFVEGRRVLVLYRAA